MTAETATVTGVFHVVSVHVDEVDGGSGLLDLTRLDEKFVDLIAQCLLGVVELTLLAGLTSVLTHDFLLADGFLNVTLLLHERLGALGESGSVLLGVDDDTGIEDVFTDLFDTALVGQEALGLRDHEWEHVVELLDLDWLLHQSQVSEVPQSILSQPNELVFSHNPANVLLVGRFLLGFASLLLHSSTRDLLLLSELSSLEPLCLNQLSIPHLLVLLLLRLDYGEFVVLEHFHSRLFQSALTEDVKHRLHFLIEVKQLWITVMNLGGLAVFLSGHPRLEQGYWGPVEIELGGNALFGSHRLVGESFEVLIGLHVHVHAAGDGFGSGDATVGVDETWPLSLLR